MTRFISSLFCVLCLFAAGLFAQADQALAVLRKNCIVCHDAKLRSGKLVMETTQGLLTGGAHGPAIVPGKSSSSRLIQMIEGRITPRMPLEGELKAEEIELLRQWIDGGAPAWTAAATAMETLRVPDIKPAPNVRAQISSLAYSPDGQTLAVAGYREIQLLDSQTRQPRRVLQGPTDVVRAIAFSPDGKILAGAGGGPARYGEIVLWDVDSGEIRRTLRGHTDYVYDVAISPDGRMVASSSYDRLIKLWDIASGAEIRTLKEHTDAVFPIAFSPDGRRLASGGADRTVKIWDPESGRRLYTLGDAADVVFTLAFDPAAQRISASGADKNIRTWALSAEGANMIQTIIAHDAEVTKIAYSRDGKRLVSAAADRTVKIWNMETSEIIKALERQPDWVLSMALSPDGKTLAIGRYDGSLGFYDLTSTIEPHRTQR